MSVIERIAAAPLVRWALGVRFFRFGLVGASGTVVNVAVLYFAREVLLANVAPQALRLNLALALAILCSTANNFFWNRLWTWHDRREHHAGKPVLVQFAQYAAACWIGIALQFVFTNLLVSAGLHYILANLAAIVLASVFNFVVNDLWTFGRRRRVARDAR
jgi:putative flippase GtrA